MRTQVRSERAVEIRDADGKLVGSFSAVSLRAGLEQLAVVCGWDNFVINGNVLTLLNHDGTISEFVALEDSAA